MNNEIYGKYPAWIRVTILSIWFSVVMICLLELGRRNQLFRFNWNRDPNIEMISLRFLIINFYQLLLLFSRIALKDNKLIPDRIKFRILFGITYSVSVSWALVIADFLDVSTLSRLHIGIALIELTYIPVLIYLFNNHFLKLMVDLKTYYESSITDSLTQLPNRVYFYDFLNRSVLQAAQQNQLTAVMYLDLDQFKSINDEYGHLTGDRVLRAVADRLSGCVRSSDMVSRLGGDEFAIILPHIKHIEDAEIVAEKILTVLSESIEIEDGEFYLTTSVGISFFPYDGITAETIVKNADRALYFAKKSGKNNYQLFNGSLSTETTFKQL